MTKQHLTVGTVVIVGPYENLKDLRGVIVAGPKFQKGKSLFKVQH